MELVTSLTKDECLFIDPNLENNHEEYAPLFSNFPSPFFDDISTISIPENKHTNQQQKPLPSPSPFETKRLNKKSKRDRHSKICTAQGYRDRRMRLSLTIARKFFDLQDLLGFDKASKTIEWLFCKSNKAIKEIVENFNPQQTNIHFSSYKEIINNEIKVDKPNEDGIKNKKNSRKNIQNNNSIKAMRYQARARARERTKKRMVIKELEESNQLIRGNPKNEINNLGLGLGFGYLMSPNNYNSTAHHLLQDLQSETVDANSFEKISGSIVGESTYCDYNYQAGWLNFSSGFLSVPEELDAYSFVTDYCNCGIVTTVGDMTGDILQF
ncbi:uncharacterized protein [Rutidosis leptorrhynchoides]|uniref:uncharacterized protein n=1 Tax=Rutidosis leptorrhynchoides TaxID=125765 RepID=UPI003A998A19